MARLDPAPLPDKPNGLLEFHPTRAPLDLPELFAAYPRLTVADVQACLAYCADDLDEFLTVTPHRVRVRKRL